MTEARHNHAHRIFQDRCKGRLHCLRGCPTRAIRVRGNRVMFFNDLCIDCGECINTCPEKVFEPVSDHMEDFESFKYSIAIPSSILYTQFGTDVNPALVNKALKNIGFDEIADVAIICAEVGYALRHHLATHPSIRPLISSFCPAVVRFVQVSYPNLVKHIEQLDVPREITARKVKKDAAKRLGLKTSEIGVIYISPCTAKVVSIKEPAEKEYSSIDGAIPIRDVFNMISPDIIRMQQKNDPICSKENCLNYGKAWGIVGHYSQNVGADRSISVAGIDHVKRILDDIENGKVNYIDFVEALSCNQGCISGGFCVQSPYVARHNSIQLHKKFGKPIQLQEERILKNYDSGYYFYEQPVLPRTTRTTRVNIAESIKRLKTKERIHAKLPKKDCCCCGAPNCETFADDCSRGEAEVDDCIFFKIPEKP